MSSTIFAVNGFIKVDAKYDTRAYEKRKASKLVKNIPKFIKYREVISEFIGKSVL